MSIDPSYNQVFIPDEFIPLLKRQDANRSLEDRVKILLAVGLFIEKQVTAARAAELAGLSLSDFIDMLHDNSIPWLEYTEENKKMDDVGIERWIADKKGKYE